MKVLFLDFDGVLNSDDWIRHRRVSQPNETQAEWIRNSFDKEAVSRLNTVIEKTEAKVVVSSSWRIVHGLSEIRGILSYHGFTGTIIGKTPRLHRTSERFLPETESVQRGEEILSWLKGRSDVEKYAVVDDDSDMEGVRHVFVQTSWAYGLLDEHVARLIALLS